MKSRVVGPWVIYRVAVKGGRDGPTAVCESGEWDAMEAARPGIHTLLRTGIANEGEAERLARGTSGDSAPKAAARVRTTMLLGLGQPAQPVLS